jgi:AraC family transcriptional regulator
MEAMEAVERLRPIEGVMQFVERASSAGRAWNLFHVRLFDSSGGYRQGIIAPANCVIMHVGRTMNSTCRWETIISRRRALAGDIDIIPMGTAAIWEEDGPSTMLAVHVTPALLRAAAQGINVNPDLIAIEPQLQLRDPLIEHIGWALKAEVESDQLYDRVYAEGLGISLAVHMLRRYAHDRSSECRRRLSQRQLRHVLDYINEHIASNLTLLEIAGVTGVSPSHFKSLFKDRMGLPVHQYVIKRRVEVATELIVRRQFKLSEVALRAGFADQSHMARCMRRVIGMTPTSVLRHCV